MARARAAAIETPRIAFAPRRLLFGVPSSATSARSRSAWATSGWPASVGAISSVTARAAPSTPLPP